MSEVITGKFEKQPKRTLRVPLSIISGELTAERFTRCDSFLTNEGAHQFYKSGRLSPDGGMQVGVFRRALQHIRMTPSERTFYEGWRDQGREQILNLALQNQPVSAERIEELRVHGDIAIHIMDTLKSLQTTLYPEIVKDINLRDISERSMEAVIRSIHGSQIK